jgi:hypothetical protein
MKLDTDAMDTLGTMADRMESVLAGLKERRLSMDQGRKHTGKVVTVLHLHRLPSSNLGNPRHEVILKVYETGRTLWCRTRANNGWAHVLSDNLEGCDAVASWTFKERGAATLDNLELIDKETT